MLFNDWCHRMFWHVYCVLMSLGGRSFLEVRRMVDVGKGGSGRNGGRSYNEDIFHERRIKIKIKEM